MCPEKCIPVEELVRVQVQHELKGFLSQLESLGRALGKSLDSFVDAVQLEKAQLEASVNGQLLTPTATYARDVQPLPPVPNEAADTLDALSLPDQHISMNPSKIGSATGASFGPLSFPEPASTCRDLDLLDSRVGHCDHIEEPRLDASSGSTTVLGFENLDSFQMLPGLKAMAFDQPPLDASGEVQVQVGVILSQVVVSCDAQDEKFSCNVTYELTWPDQRLRSWESSDESVMRRGSAGTSFKPLPGNLWTPVRRDAEHGVSMVIFALPRRGEGLGFTVEAPFVLEGRQDLDQAEGPWLRQRITGVSIAFALNDFARLRSFPFDVINVDILMSCFHILRQSPDDSGEQVVRLIQRDNKAIDIVGTVGGGEWELRSVSLAESNHGSPNLKNITYSDVILSVALKRHSTYYEWKACMPLASCIAILACLFGARFDSEEGFSLRLSGFSAVLFVIFAIMQNVSTAVPKNPVLTVVDRIANASVFMTVLAAMESTILHIWTHRLGDLADIANLNNIDAVFCCILTLTYFLYFGRLFMHCEEKILRQRTIIGPTSGFGGPEKPIVLGRRSTKRLSSNAWST